MVEDDKLLLICRLTPRCHLIMAECYLNHAAVASQLSQTRMKQLFNLLRQFKFNNPCKMIAECWRFTIHQNQQMGKWDITVGHNCGT